MMRLIRVVLSSLGNVASFPNTNLTTIHESYLGGSLFLGLMGETTDRTT